MSPDTLQNWTRKLDRVEATLSVAMLITDSRGRLILVRRKDGSWGLPAGGKKSDDPDFYAAAQRETAEETGGILSNLQRKGGELTPWTTIEDHGVSCSVGFVYDVTTTTLLPDDGLALTGPETDWVRAFEAEKLMDNLLSGQMVLYRPKMNGPQILRYLRSSAANELSGLEMMRPEDWQRMLESSGFNDLERMLTQ